MIRDAYKIAAGQDMQGNSVGIGMITLSQTMTQCEGLVDGQTLKNTDLDIGKTAVKSADSKLKNKLIPVERLIRYNFLEF